MNGVDYYRDRRVNRSQYNRLTFWGKFWGGVIGVRLSKLERLRCRVPAPLTSHIDTCHKCRTRSAGRIALHQAPGPLHVSSVREPSRLLILGRLLGI